MRRELGVIEDLWDNFLCLKIVLLANEATRVAQPRPRRRVLLGTGHKVLVDLEPDLGWK
jgi:predicted NAD-dependent protein-ADP-ribosyltransferase YbiA (DUF1768 family)